VTKTQTNSSAICWQVVKQQQKLGIGPNLSNNNAHKQKKKHTKKKTLPLDSLGNLLPRF
jgi:hypothetical protein